jgi:hypothetical protein
MDLKTGSSPTPRPPRQPPRTKRPSFREAEDDPLQPRSFMADRHLQCLSAGTIVPIGKLRS